MKRMTAGEWGLLLQKVALAALPPFTVLLVRVALAAAALTLTVAVAGRACPRPVDRGLPSRSWRRSTTSFRSA